MSTTPINLSDDEANALVRLIESTCDPDLEEVYHRLQAEGFDGSTGTQDEDPLVLPRNDEDPNWRFQMYTRIGNALVCGLVESIRIRAESGEFQNREEMAAATTTEMNNLASQGHGEVWDTEPRGEIADRLDAICLAKGWAFDPYDSGLG